MNDTVVALLRNNAEHAKQYGDRFDDVQRGQHPDAVTVSCADSRVLQDRVWGNDEPGRVFTCANIGNRVVQKTDGRDVVAGDVLYPIEYTATDTVIVMGHTGCGAVTAVYDALTGRDDDRSDSSADGHVDPPGIDHCLDLLKPHLQSDVDSLPADLDRADAVNRLVEANVDRQVQFLVESGDVPPDVDVVGAVYDFQDVYSDRRGAVHVVNVDGETSVEILRDRHPEIAERIARLDPASTGQRA